MLLVPCPHCGPRNAADLRYVGEAIARPDPATVGPDTWRGYLYLRDNPAGWLTETWYCRSGCRRYFTLERHTVTNEFRNSPLPFAKGERSDPPPHGKGERSGTPPYGKGERSGTPPYGKGAPG